MLFAAGNISCVPYFPSLGASIVTFIHIEVLMLLFVCLGRERHHRMRNWSCFSPGFVYERCIGLQVMVTCEIYLTISFSIILVDVVKFINFLSYGGLTGFELSRHNKANNLWSRLLHSSCLCWSFGESFVNFGNLWSDCSKKNNSSSHWSISCWKFHI